MSRFEMNESLSSSNLPSSMSVVLSKAVYLPVSCLPSHFSLSENSAGSLSLKLYSHFQAPVGSTALAGAALEASAASSASATPESKHTAPTGQLALTIRPPTIQVLIS